MTGNLQGTRVLITREERQAQELENLVSHYGGTPVVAPLLTISCKRDGNQQKIIQQRSSYSWIFFTSANGVHCFYQLLQEQRHSGISLSNCFIGAVGSKTATTLEDYGFTADFIPTTYNADTMAKEFFARFSAPGPVLLVRGSMSRSVLPEALAKSKVPYETIDVYDTLFNYEIKDRINELTRDKAYDVMTFTSPSTVKAFMEMVETTFTRNTLNIPAACVGTTTEQTAKFAGFTNTITPDVFTIEHMIATISDYITRKG